MCFCMDAGFRQEKLLQDSGKLVGCIGMGSKNAPAASCRKEVTFPLFL